MKRKQPYHIRSIQTDFEPRTFDTCKQNDKESYRMDPKIIQLKKKYQIDKTLQRSNTNPSLKHHSAGPTQQQVFRKLQNIKSQLQAIPGWQRHVKSILFQQQSFTKQNDHAMQISKNQLNCLSRIGPESRKQESIQQNKFLTSSNLSFKVNQTSSIERSDLMIKQAKDFNHQTPIKKVKQFELQKHKYSNKERKIEGNQDQKNVDQKINEISRKIRQAEIKKKNLGVDFVPFERKSNFHNETDKNIYQYKSRTPDLSNYDRFKEVISIQKQSKPPKPSKSISKIGVTHQLPSKNVFDQISPRFALQYDYSKQIKKQQTKVKPIAPIYEQTQNKFSWQKQMLLNKDKKFVRTYSNHPTSQNIVHPYEQKDLNKLNKQNIKSKIGFFEKIEQPIHDRKKKYPEKQQKTNKKQITTKLVQAFCEQVKLDEKFRNNKLWLKASKNQKKFERLKSLLQMQGFNLPTDKIIEQFQVLQKQDNPFFSVTSQTCDIEQVAFSYIECEKYWRKNLYKKFNRDALEDEDFSSLTIDLQKKGYISLEDLVRFLNMETGTFFRNRDLFTIFRRLSNNGQKLTFTIFLNTFCL